MMMGKKTTVCLLTLDNGYEVVGTSAVVDPSNFDYEIGKKYALEDAYRKLGQIEGFIMTEHMHIALAKLQQESEQK